MFTELRPLAFGCPWTPLASCSLLLKLSMHWSEASMIPQIGPRMELEIVKAEEGMCNGQVLYHQHITKPAAEVAEKTKELQDREELRQKRRRQQAGSQFQPS